jgi:hypothetical protein
MGFPEIEQAAENTDLRFLSVRQGLEHGVELGDGGKRVGEGFVAQIEECLDKHLDFDGIVHAVDHILLTRGRIQFLKKYSPYTRNLWTLVIGTFLNLFYQPELQKRESYFLYTVP